MLADNQADRCRVVLGGIRACPVVVLAGSSACLLMLVGASCLHQTVTMQGLVLYIWWWVGGMCLCWCCVLAVFACGFVVWVTGRYFGSQLVAPADS